MAGQGGLVVGVLRVTAVGGLTGAVVLGRGAGATKVQYTPCGKQVASISDDERRSVPVAEKRVHPIAAVID